MRLGGVFAVRQPGSCPPAVSLALCQSRKEKQQQGDFPAPDAGGREDGGGGGGVVDEWREGWPRVEGERRRRRRGEGRVSPGASLAARCSTNC